MSDHSPIEWTDATWNPVRGCARVSPGCENCYAERVAHRFSAPGGKFAGLTVLGKHGPRWAGEARFIPEKLGEPLTWRKPRRIFVNSMSDLFHDDVTDEQIAAVFGVMAAAYWHTFQVLTKRPERAVRWFEWIAESPVSNGGRVTPARGCLWHTWHLIDDAPVNDPSRWAWPLPNIWLGVSAEDQKRADERIPPLLQCPAAVRFVSAEPLLGPIDFTRVNGSFNALAQDRLAPASLDWVIVGGESGPGARECELEWIRSIVAQCDQAGVACFVKQLGATIRVPESEPLGDTATGWSPFARTCVSDDFLVRLPNRKGGDINEWPHDLRVRQFPEVRP